MRKEKRLTEKSRMDKTEQYIFDVSQGTIVTGSLVKGAVARHLADLARVNSTDFPYHYEQAKADRVIAFIENLKHIRGEWAEPGRDNHLILEPWQHFIISMLFGWIKTDGNRRFTKSYVSCARKSGKTMLAAAIMVFTFFADGEIGAEVYSLASKRDQAKIVWDTVAAMIAKNPYLKEQTQIYKQTSTVIIPGTSARIRALGRDSDTEDGLSPSMACIDEYHVHKSSSQPEVMAAGMGSRRQPLLFIITTAGFDLNSVCYTEEHKLSQGILEGTLDPVPENYFCIIYTLDEEDDWTNEDVWLKANPNLDISVNRQYLRDRVKEALASPTKRNKVLVKNLNIWTQTATRWFTPEQWGDCGAEVDRKKLAGEICILGMDLSASQDITALALCFPRADDKYEFLFEFFLPREGIVEKDRKDRIPYSLWAEQGFLTLTEGNVVDLDFIEHRIREIAKEFSLVEVCYDTWHSQAIVPHLMDDEIAEMVPISQNYSGMGAGTDSFEKKVLGKLISHGNNPVMAWMISCTELKSDRQGSFMTMKPRRESSGKRIDGVVAAILAISRAGIYKPPEKSVYEDRGVISL